MDEAEPLGGRLRLGHPGPDHALDVLHRRGGDLVREPHPLDLLRGLDRARLVEQRRRVLRLRERVEPRLREGRRLADHPVGRLRAERELDPDRLVLLGERRREVERAERRRPRVALVVAGEEPEVGRPGRPLRVVARRLEADQRRLALGREDDGVVALHPPEVRQVEDVVGRADDERVEAALAHQRADAVELRVVARPAHRPSVCASLTVAHQASSPQGRTRGSGGVPWPSCQEMTGLRSTPMRSISASITSPGLR